MNCETVMPENSESDAQVSPTRAVTTSVQGSAAKTPRTRTRSVASASERRMIGKARCPEAASSGVGIFAARKLSAVDVGWKRTDAREARGNEWEGAAASASWLAGESGDIATGRSGDGGRFTILLASIKLGGLYGCPG
jgi:hypothetical protein